MTITPAQRREFERASQTSMAKTMRAFTQPLEAIRQMAERSAAITTDLGAWLKKYGGTSPWLKWQQAEAEALATSEADIRRKARVVAVPQDEPVADTPAEVILCGRPAIGPPPKTRNSTPDLARDGAPQNGIRRLTKNRRLSNKPSSKTQAPQALHVSRDLVGYLRGTEAFDLTGNSLGRFKNRSDAVGTALAAYGKEALAC